MRAQSEVFFGRYHLYSHTHIYIYRHHRKNTKIRLWGAENINKFQDIRTYTHIRTYMIIKIVKTDSRNLKM